eukprot:Skav227613  [mRNA]  locus=scaffold1141:613726:632679:- [translate_table: standard]
MELYSVASQKSAIADATSTVVKPGEEAPIGWADPYALRQFGVKVVIGEEDSSMSLEQAHHDQSVASDNASTVEVDVQLCQVGVSLVDDEPVPRELLFIHVGDIQLGYKQNVTEDKEENLGDGDAIDLGISWDDMKAKAGSMAEDIFRKPVQGARQDGAKGLAVGCGTGIAGTVVKPVVGVGNAASDIITGISAAATFDSAAKRRRIGLAAALAGSPSRGREDRRDSWASSSGLGKGNVYGRMEVVDSVLLNEERVAE